MKKDQIKSIANKFLRTFRISFAILLLTTIILLCTDINFIIKLVIVFLFVVLVTFILPPILNNIYILPIINNELNPQKYYAILCAASQIGKVGFNEALVAYLIGDFNAVINICTLKLKGKTSLVYKFLFIQYLARAYFELADFENLKAACEKFDVELSKLKPKKSQRIRNLYGRPIEYYKRYLNEDYKGCKEIYAKLFDSNNFKNYKFTRIATYYPYAIAMYKLGEYEEAEKFFEKIICEAPLLFYSKSAKKYVDAIKSGTEIKHEVTKIVIDELYEIPQSPRVEKDLNKGLFALVVLFLLLAFFFFAPLIF